MSVLTLAEAKAALNIDAPTYDTELQDVIDAAEAAIAKKVGPLSSVAKTERVNGGGCGLTLLNTPVVSLTSVTPVGGSAYTLTDLQVDSSSGVVEWVSGSAFYPGRYTVVYQAGRTTVPEDLITAIKKLVVHLWDDQRGGSAMPGSRPADIASSTLVNAGYAFPFSVQQLLTPHTPVGND